MLIQLLWNFISADLAYGPVVSILLMLARVKVSAKLNTGHFV